MNCVIIIKSPASVPIFPHLWSPLFIFKCANLSRFLSPPAFSGFVPEPKNAFLTALSTYSPSPLLTGASHNQGCAPRVSETLGSAAWQLTSVSFGHSLSLHTRGCSGLFEVPSWVPRWEMCLNCSGHYIQNQGILRAPWSTGAVAAVQCGPGKKKELEFLICSV